MPTNDNDPRREMAETLCQYLNDRILSIHKGNPLDRQRFRVYLWLGQCSIYIYPGNQCVCRVYDNSIMTPGQQLLAEYSHPDLLALVEVGVKCVLCDYGYSLHDDLLTY
jgi:hypothetical protein